MGILEVRGLHSGYGDVQILHGCNLSVEEGRLTALVGANGAGKTTLLHTVMGLIRPVQGKIKFKGEEITNLSAHEKAEKGLILVPEGRQLFTTMTVAENLQMGATPERARPQVQANTEKVYGLFPRLKERLNQKAGTLSGGEQQMLAVARGIMAEPVVFMIDELSLGLAPAISMQLLETLVLLRHTGMTILLVEQNVQMALAICDYAYVLSEGQMELEGTGHELIENEMVRVAYLGFGPQAAGPPVSSSVGRLHGCAVDGGDSTAPPSVA
jgi:branched-chain amino acid transport system ATP-binding protein